MRLLEAMFVMVAGLVLAALAAVAILFIAGSTAINTIIGSGHGQYRN